MGEPFQYSPGFPGSEMSSYFNFFNLIMFIVIAIIIGSIIYRIIYKTRATVYHTSASKAEQSARPYQTDISFKIDPVNRKKLGYPDDFSTFDNHCVLVKETDGILHFNYPNSPQIQLINAEYTPKYRYQNNYQHEGFNTSTPQEIESDGILTFKNLSGNQQVIIKAILKEDLYIRLKTEFLTLT